jgi:AmmeMemoRadiSam system protein B/AmmeMemoRadiSam system protein A
MATPPIPSLRATFAFGFIFALLSAGVLLISAQAGGISPSAPPVTPTATLPTDRLRPSALAGLWYPADPEELRRTVDDLLAAATPVDGIPLGLLVPHAGYLYSGSVAAASFKQLVGRPIDVAIIISSDHQPPLARPIAVYAEGGFATPLGVVAVDAELAHALIAADARITDDPGAHVGEHMIEIELPFLQRVCPDCRIVPILMGSDDDETVKALTDALLAVLPGRRAVVIASSDLSHYPSGEDAQTVDHRTLEAILSGNPAHVRQTIRQQMAHGYPGLLTCACAEAPILVTMQVAQGLGADSVQLLRYANSGDAPGVSSDQVVGYGAVMWWRYEPPDMTPARRTALLKLARDTIAAYLADGSVMTFDTDDPELQRPLGVFVTLKTDGQLRGCIGHLRGDRPLWQAVQAMAIAAATEDPRFPPLTPDELADVRIEISVLSPLRRLDDVAGIEIGRHGLLLDYRGQQGVFLPQVPVEQGWDRGQYLDQLCLKAGLIAGCWRDEAAALYTFTAVVFGEE